MIGGVQQHYAPNTFVILQHINAGVILLNLPEVRHIKAKQIADDRLVHCVMRSNQHSFAGIFFCIVVKGSARTLAHILQVFTAVRHLYQVRLGVPQGKLLRKLLGDFRCQHAFPAAVIDFQQTLICCYRQLVQISTELAGLVGALQRAGDAHIDMDVVQALGQQVTLAQATLAQRRILLPLVSAFYIPGCFAMSD